MFRLTFYPIFDSYLLVVVVALVLAGLLWFGPSRLKAKRTYRVALTLLRAAVLALLTLAMLRPTLIYTQTKKQAATLVVLADQSRSMTVPDAVGDKTRWDALRAALDEAAPALARLQRDFELKAFTFDAELHAASVEKGWITLPDKPDGQQTALGASLERVMQDEAGKRLLGVVLLSDGAQRAYAPNDLAPQTAAARMKHMGCRLFTFPLGQSRGLGDAKDVAVKDLVVNPDVFVKNELAVSGQVRVDGYVDVPIPVRLLFETSPGKMEVVSEETVKAVADGQILPIRMTYIPQTAGDWRLTLEIADQQGELVTTNNRLSTFVRVLQGGLNVLYIEGTPRPELASVRRSLGSSPEVKLDSLLIDPLDPRTRPANLAESFKPGKYEVYILGDVDATAFRDGELGALAECVSRGAGLMMLGGLQSFGAGGYADTPLAKVLPVGMNSLERQRPGEPTRSDLHWPGPLPMRPTPLGLAHFALTLADTRQENADLWSKLPPLQGANKLHDLAPGALVLADSGEDKPLLVAQSYGEGRVLALAGDSTWLWRMHGYESAHKRFWRQLILWLARKDQAQEGRVWIQMPQRRFAPSQRVEFTVGATSPTGEAIPDAMFKTEIILPDESRRPLALMRQEEQMAGVFRETQTPGDYAIEVTATQKDKPLGSAKARFLVFQQDLELDNASADASTLESLAAMTGGQSLAPEQLPELIQRLTDETASLDVRQETKKSFWDTWAFFLMFVGLLCVEWYLRKRWGLV